MKAESFSPRRLLQSMTLGTAVSVAVALLATTASVTPVDAFAATAKTHQAAKKAASSSSAKKSVKAASAKSADVASADAPRAKASRKRMTLAANVHGHRGAVRKVAFQPRRPTVGQAFGLHDTPDALALRSSVAYVVDQNTGEPLFDKNSHAVVPIASISKLMTAMVVLDAKSPMTDQLEVTDEDRDYEKGTGSRLSVGSVLSREDMLHIALMASENRAAAALSRYYPGGRPAFIAAMNAKAKSLGMNDTHFENSTGLSSSNVSSARDLVKMVNAAYQYPMIRQFSTDRTYDVYTGKRNLVYNSTNALIRGNGSWDIGLQKTGFINEAGECLVMQATIHGRPMVMVLLDSFGKYSRFADASRLRNWLDAGGGERLTAANTANGGT
ncbi:D-alanyl-D-alanine endopeptidase [Burkholderia ambifaria]|uniref:Murein-DD-endopeptidase, Serine peptidase, MEROPS family S11 n=3 Tax=Burkholderia ambifaria TaxID=152480 RepID=Q0BDP7_BURCM|nr:D-alanyl-D-alanine endopeptidase [Burkholderia ambifaria]MDP9586576.1 D-alanyl-D-alanine endopeptidase (penicillin-binding protein 7) [Burkholderia contaminans]ABI87726.1 murein-DD-endopeptidase, Serine peptidase, MEROPS family S11 [Burkholderia ambifaria AMMD]ACB64524.1 peptidase S11 D-alanyl-D-alanine carboxypeptidase 1 [Burkholderia ambifaria MC40-6]AJY23321.1 D-alanyl-D-alanine carboxypeptidase family protein [Burkholderia ambifaria AMMD]ELK6209297.1 D-alanyl-D-alanine endopeptidase [Bu